MNKFLFVITITLFLFQINNKNLYAQNILELFSDTAEVSRNEISTDSPPISKTKWNSFKTKFITINIGLAVFLDYGIVDQDDESIAQVGKIDPAVEFRAERIILSGEFPFFKYPWRYLIAANYNGLDAPDDKKQIFGIIDLNVEIPFGKKGGWMTVGKQKEGVGHEYLAPGSQGMFMERGSGAPALIKQRNIGIKYSNSILENRMTVELGAFNSWIEFGNENSFSDNGIVVTSRVTGLPTYKSDRDLVHLGLCYKFAEVTNGKFTYKARPESNTAPYYINTGAFDAANANTLMLEGIFVKNQFSVIAEFMNAFVNSSTHYNPSFNYWQIAGSWFITGDNRRYNRQTGNLGKLIPLKDFGFTKNSGPGAIELAMRYTKSNFTDNELDGGKLGRYTVALSWFLNTHFRFMVNYGAGKLNKLSLNGSSNFLQFRGQYEL